MERVVATMVAMALDVLEDEADRSLLAMPPVKGTALFCCVERVGIQKGTSGTASAGGVVDGYSYFGNESNPDPEDDSPLSRQSEWITQFAKQRTTGYSKERKINTFADALEVEMHVLLGQFPPQHHVILFNSLMLDRRNKKRWKLENIALMCLIYRSTSTIGSKLKSLVALTLLSMPSL